MKIELKINEENSKVSDIKIQNNEVNILWDNVEHSLLLKEGTSVSSPLTTIFLEINLDVNPEEDDFDARLLEIQDLTISGANEEKLTYEDFDLASFNQNFVDTLMEVYKDLVIESRSQILKIAKIMGKDLKGIKKRSSRSGTRKKNKYSPPWSDQELLIALRIYVQFSNGEANKVEVEKIMNDHGMDRSIDAMMMKLANYAAIDPNNEITGLDRTGSRTKEIFEEHYEAMINS